MVEVAQGEFLRKKNKNNP